MSYCNGLNLFIHVEEVGFALFPSGYTEDAILLLILIVNHLHRSNSYEKYITKSSASSC